MDQRCRVHIESFRHRRTDPRGISHKACIDGLVDAGILDDDSSKQVKRITDDTTKIPTAEPETTVITLWI